MVKAVAVREVEAMPVSVEVPGVVVAEVEVLMKEENHTSITVTQNLALATVNVVARPFQKENHAKEIDNFNTCYDT
jgi:acyl CoA:acetate/3-ketoacid CoA transferase